MAAVTENISRSKRAAAANPLARLVEAARAGVARRSKINQTIRELEQLSDRELNDIGVHRSEIRRIAESSI